MKICNKVKDNVGRFPVVKKGDLVEITLFDKQTELFLVVSGNFLHSLINGNFWSDKSTWGSTLCPENVKVVTDEYCLTRI